MIEHVKSEIRLCEHRVWWWYLCRIFSEE